MPKRKQHLPPRLLIIPIPYKHILAVQRASLIAFEVEESRIIFIAHGEGQGQFSGGVGGAEEDGGDGGAGFVAAEPGVEEGGDGGDPGHGDRGTGLEDYDCAGVCGGDGGD